MGGRSRVNTHTGSVGVAVPQSNIVNVKSDEKCASLLCTKMSGEQCQACGVKPVCVRSAVEQFQCLGLPTDVKLATKNSNLKNVANQSSKSKVRSTSSSNSTYRLREYFTKLAAENKFGGHMGCGENSNITPIKRKLCDSNIVASLVPKYMPHLSNPTVISPGESTTEFGSPAKRSKLEKD